MIRFRHPSKYYILYLMTRRSMGPAAIAATLGELGLPVPLHLEQPKPKTNKKGKVVEPPRTVVTYDSFLRDLERLQAELAFPPGFHPLRKDHGPSQAFLRQLGVADFWRSDSATMTAYMYMQDPHICRMLQTMLLGPLGFLAISRRLSEKFKLPPTAMNPQIVRAFAHYFWNYDLLNKVEWEQVLYDWLVGDNTDLHVALRSPRSSVGVAMVFNLVDQGGSESLKEVLMYRWVRDTSFMEAVKSSVSMYSGVAKAQTLMMLTQAMVQSQEQLDMRRGGSAELLEELRRIEATYDPKILTTIQELPLEQLPADGMIDAEYEVAYEPRNNE